MADSDQYYVPPHISTAFEKQELKAFVDVFIREDGADGDADGYIEVSRLEELMDAAGEKPTDKKKREILSECDPKNSGDVHFLDLLRCLSRYRFKRDAFGGKRRICDDYPLPRQVATEYDKPCMQHPDRRAQVR